MAKQVCVVAFSGGLDTSYCVATLKEHYNVITASIDTGSFSPDERNKISDLSQKLGAMKHYCVDARQRFYDEFICPLIRGNVLRGGAYPLSVSSERTVQAMEVSKIAQEVHANAIAHGSTGAGNDQVRFEVVFSAVCPGMTILAPVRDRNISRSESALFLKQSGVEIDKKTSRYSINRGLWGTTIGGGETHNAWEEVPDEAFSCTLPLRETPDEPEELVISFEHGLPVAIDSARMGGVELICALEKCGGKHGVGRGIHVGTTVLGVKGRLAFEAPAPLILISAHHELEKLVLTREQQSISRTLSEAYGQAVHEGRYLELAMRDIEAYWESQQKRVCGDVRVRLYKGKISVIGTRSQYSLLNKGAVYGEQAVDYNPIDVAGFCKLFSQEIRIAYQPMKKP